MKNLKWASLLLIAIIFFASAKTSLLPLLLITATATPSDCSSDGTILVGVDTVGGAMPPFVYSLTGRLNRNPQSDSMFRALLPGLYTVSVVDANGERGQTTITVLGNYLPPVLIATQPQPTTVMLIVRQGRPPFRFTYKRNGIPSGDTSSTGIYTCLSSGNYVFELLDSCQNIYPQAILIPNQSLYFNATCRPTGNLTDVQVSYVSGGTPPYLFICRSNTGEIDSNRTGNFPRRPGCSFVVEMQDSCGNIFRQAVNCTAQNLRIDLVCANLDSGIALFRPFNGKPPYTFSVENAPQAIIRDSLISNLPLGRDYYRFWLTDSCGNRTRIDVYPFRINNKSEITCPFDSTLRLTAYRYLTFSDGISNWSGYQPSLPITYRCLNCPPSVSAIIVDSTGIGAVYKPLPAGPYTVVARNSCGEQDTITVLIRPDTMPPLQVEKLSFCSVNLRWENSAYRMPRGTFFTVTDSLTGQIVKTDSMILTFSGLKPNTAYCIRAYNQKCGSRQICLRTKEVDAWTMTVKPNTYGGSVCQGWDVRINTTATMSLLYVETGQHFLPNTYSYSPNFEALMPGTYILTRGDCVHDTFVLPNYPIGYLRLQANLSCPELGRIVASGGFSNLNWLHWLAERGLVLNPDTSYYSPRMTYTLGDSLGRILYVNGASVQNFSGILEGSYLQQDKTYIVFCGNGYCRDSARIRIPPYRRSIIQVLPKPVCGNAIHGDLEVIIQNGSPPYTVEILELGIRIVSDSPTVIVPNLPLGTFTVRVYDYCRISDERRFSIAPLSIVANFERFCNGLLRLNGTIVEGATYQWINTATNQTVGNSPIIMFSNNHGTAQNFKYIIRTPSCSFEKMLAVPAMTAPPSVALAGNDTTIGGYTTRLNATLPTRGFGVWTQASTNRDTSFISDTLSATPSVSVRQPGRFGYIWTVNGGLNGCFAFDTVWVTFVNCAGVVPLNFKIQKTDPTYCDATGSIKIKVQNATTALRFIWSNGATQDSLNALAAGTYNVTITDNDVCTRDTVLTITLTKPVFTRRIDTAICSGSVFKLYNFQFSTAGEHITRWQGAYCDTIFTILLRLKRRDSVLVIQNLCDGEVFRFGDTLIRNSGNYRHTFQNTEGCDSTVSLSIFFQKTERRIIDRATCDSAAIGNIVDTFRNRYGCDSVFIERRTRLVFTDTTRLSETICYGDSFRFGTISLKNEGVYTRIAANTDGCHLFVLTLAVKPRRYFERIEKTICKGDRITILGETFSSEGRFIREKLTANGCPDIYEIIISFFPQLSLTASIQNLSCADEADGNILLTVSGGVSPYQIVWSNGYISKHIYGLSAGTYSVTVTDGNGCRSSSKFVVDAPKPLQIIFFVEQPKCFSVNTGSIFIQNISGGNGGYALRLNGRDYPFNKLPFRIDNLDFGKYRLALNDSLGCVLTKEFEIRPAPERKIDIMPKDTTIELGNKVKLQLQPNFVPLKLLWESWDIIDCDTCLTPTIRPTKTQWVICRAWDSAGCEVRKKRLIHVSKKDCPCFIPNIIYPDSRNPDNAYFKIHSSSAVQHILTVKIFNRWGGCVYEKNDFNTHLDYWDGTLEGRYLPPDVFVYFVKVLLINGEEITCSGDLTLVH